MCDKCECEYAAVGGLCAVCLAEGLFPVAEVVESSRARYVGTGARLSKSEQDYHECTSFDGSGSASDS